MVLKLNESMTDGEKDFFAKIDKFGWHVMNVENTDGQEGPTFSYSTGIFEHYGKPELIVFGLKKELRQSVINLYGEDIRNGTRGFTNEHYYDGFIEGFEILMLDAGEVARKDYACWADWYYERKPFPILQCVWPSTSGVWPWDDDASDDLRAWQPLLGKPPKLHQ